MTQSIDPGRGPWHVTPFADLIAMVSRRSEDRRRPWIVAIDGRSASGKSTLAQRLASAMDGVAIVHTDDLAWHEPLFAWGSLLRDGVLTPLLEHGTVTFIPPAWRARDREGAIVVPPETTVVIVEGVGATQRAVADLIDLAIWVHADAPEARRRGLARDIASGVNGDEAESIAFWDEWDTAERTFLDQDRPWERADLIISGTPHLSLGAGEVLVTGNAAGGG